MGSRRPDYGFWGFSPAQSPRGGYQIYGVKAIGTDPLGYLSYDIGPPVPQVLQTRPASAPRIGHGVVTPHASFLALRYAPREAIANLRALTTRFPIYSQFGFQDSVDVSAGVVSGYILALDQGMIMAAIANELADDAMQHAFSDGQVEKAIRPLIAMEEFSSTPAQTLAHRPGRGRASSARGAGPSNRDSSTHESKQSCESSIRLDLRSRDDGGHPCPGRGKCANASAQSDRSNFHARPRLFYNRCTRSILRPSQPRQDAVHAHTPSNLPAWKPVPWVSSILPKLT